MPDPALKMPLVQMVNTDDKIVPLNLGPWIFLETAALRDLPVPPAPNRCRRLPCCRSWRGPREAVTCPWRESSSPSSWRAALPSLLALLRQPWTAYRSSSLTDISSTAMSKRESLNLFLNEKLENGVSYDFIRLLSIDRRTWKKQMGSYYFQIKSQLDHPPNQWHQFCWGDSERMLVERCLGTCLDMIELLCSFAAGSGSLCTPGAPRGIFYVCLRSLTSFA